jgi:hypothetical protein
VLEVEERDAGDDCTRADTHSRASDAHLLPSERGRARSTSGKWSLAITVLPCASSIIT